MPLILMKPLVAQSGTRTCRSSPFSAGDGQFRESAYGKSVSCFTTAFFSFQVSVEGTYKFTYHAELSDDLK